MDQDSMEVMTEQLASGSTRPRYVQLPLTENIKTLVEANRIALDPQGKILNLFYEKEDSVIIPIPPFDRDSQVVISSQDLEAVEFAPIPERSVDTPSNIQIEGGYRGNNQSDHDSISEAMSVNPLIINYECIIQHAQTTFATILTLDRADIKYKRNLMKYINVLCNIEEELQMKYDQAAIPADLIKQINLTKFKASDLKYDLQGDLKELEDQTLKESDPHFIQAKAKETKITEYRNETNLLADRSDELLANLLAYDNQKDLLAEKILTEIEIDPHQFLTEQCPDRQLICLKIEGNSINISFLPKKDCGSATATSSDIIKRKLDLPNQDNPVNSLNKRVRIYPSEVPIRDGSVDSLTINENENFQTNTPQQGAEYGSSIEPLAPNPQKQQESNRHLDLIDPIVTTNKELNKDLINNANPAQTITSDLSNQLNNDTVSAITQVLAQIIKSQEGLSCSSKQTVDKDRSYIEVPYNQGTDNITNKIPELWKVDPNSGNSSHVSVKLPKHVITPWNGKRTTYPDFIESFRMYVHLNQGFLVPQKIQQLEYAIPDKIREVIRHHPQNDDGYSSRLQYLHERYGDLTKLRAAYWMEITGFPNAAIHSNSVRNTTDRLKALIFSYRKYALTIDEEQLYHACITKFNKACYSPFINHEIKHVDELFRATLQWAKVQELAMESGQPPFQIERRFGKTGNAKPLPVFTTKACSNKRDIKNKKGRQDKSSIPLQANKKSNKPNVENPFVTGPPKNLTRLYSHPKNPCVFCKQNHHSFLCVKYDDIGIRRARLASAKRCESCLNPHQLRTECRNKHLQICKWFQCAAKGQHNTAFCPNITYPITKQLIDDWHQRANQLNPKHYSKMNDLALNHPIDIDVIKVNSASQMPTTMENNSKRKNPSTFNQEQEEAKPKLSKLPLFTIKKELDSCLLLFQLYVRNAQSLNKLQVSGFLDSGSPRTFILEETAQNLQLKKLSTELLQLEGVESIATEPFESTRVELILVRPDKVEVRIEANTIRSIAWDLPQVNDQLFYKHYPEHKDKTFCRIPQKHKIQLLIGNDIMWSFITRTIQLDHSTTLIGTQFGWMISGTRYAECNTEAFTPVFFNTPNSIENLWKLEVLGIEAHNPGIIQDEIDALEQFFKNIEIVNNRYQIRWLYRYNPPNLADNFNVAFKRLQNQIPKLQSSADFRERYTTYFSSLLDLKMIEECSEQKKGTLVHYLPHKGILDLTKSTPLRVVFDASSHGKGQLSLNECMFKGTNFLVNILLILFNFQKEEIAIIADIKKAFHQISLHEDDRDVTRFLWLKDPKRALTRDNIIIYRFTCVPFGIVTSPFILAATLLYHFQHTDKTFYNKFAKHFYVDNLVTSVATISEANDLYHRANGIFQEVSMELAQWGSSNPQIRSIFNSSHAIEKDVTKVLGLVWDMQKDILYLNPKIPKMEVYTKRTFLQYTSSIYDPIGWFAPALVHSRAFIKRLWELGLKWDEKLPSDMQEVAKLLITNLEKVFDYVFPRRLFPTNFNPDNIQIHTFVDASQVAYAFVVYLRLEAPNSNQVMIRFRFGKSRITPLKGVTIPKLELMAALIGTRAITTVRSALSIEYCKAFLWSDSKCALTWKLERKILTPFVANRVKEMNEVPDVTYRYVPSIENPADIGSRGATVDELVDSTWWTGPAWLYKAQKEWPVTDLHLGEDLKELDIPHSECLETSLRLKLFACPNIRAIIPSKKSQFWDGKLTARQLRISKSKHSKMYHFTIIPGSQDYELIAPTDPEAINSQQLSSNTVQSQSIGQHELKKYNINNLDYSSFSNFESGTPFGINIEAFTSLRKLLNTFHGCLKGLRKFYCNSNNKLPVTNKCWSWLPTSFAHAFLAFIWADQRLYFQPLIETLSKVEAPEFIVYEKFHIVIDEFGILRLRNYLPFSPYSDDITSPILFHPKSYLLRLTVLHVHINSYHAGTKFTLAAFKRSYFVPKCQKTVTGILKKYCQKCKKETIKPFFQPTYASLPDFRLFPFNCPFTYVGVDALGPFEVFKSYLRKQKKDVVTRHTPVYKMWILLFTCLSTRAVHLSVVKSLDSEDIWLAFCEFFADRTTPKFILSDNAATFTMLALYIPKFWESFISQANIASDLREKGIQWSFTPAKAPWYGGVYERLVGLVKQTYYRTLSHHPVLERVLRSTVKGIQTMINERPLCPAVDEAEQMVLTPAHFLHAKLGGYKKDTELPEKGASISSTQMLKFWRIDQEYQTQIWLMWKHLYLTHLRDKIPQGVPNAYRTHTSWPKVGDVVHVLDSKTTFGTYKLAKVTAIVPSTDGKIRHANIKFASGADSSRPLKFLAPLELCAPISNNDLKHAQVLKESAEKSFT